MANLIDIIYKKIIKTKKDISLNRNYIFINPYSYYLLRKSKLDFKKIDSICIDGKLLVIILNIIFKAKIERISFDFTSLAPIVLRDIHDKSLTLAIIGTEDSILVNSLKIIKENYPGIKIIFSNNGYFSELEKKDIFNKLKELKPDVVIIGMGTPLQEEFLVQSVVYGIKSSIFTCGGFLHQIVDGLDYYPNIFNKLNLRWLYRMFKEKLFYRYFFLYPLSIYLIFIDSILINKGKQK